MLPDRVSNPGPLTYESGALPTALRGPANEIMKDIGKYMPVALKLYFRSPKLSRCNCNSPFVLSKWILAL